MTTNSLPQDPTEILAGVESFFDELPAKRRGRRTHAEINAPQDDAPESENYDKLSPFDALCAGQHVLPTDERIQALLLAWEIKGRIRSLCRMAGKAGQLAGSYSSLCQLVDQLTALAGGKDVGKDVVPAFLALPFERKRMIVYAMSGTLFDSEAEIVRYMNQPYADGE